MDSPDPPPLWREVVGDTEPWRRGRMFLIIFAALTFLFQGLLLSALVLHGALEAVFASGIFALLFWLLFYFIWIGVHWVRWVTGAINALYGFYIFFQGLSWSLPILIVSGIYSFIAGAYLGLAPAVYFFAQRQRETRRWGEAVAVGAAFLLVVLSLATAMIGLLHYKRELEGDAYSFANEAFARVFAKHDTYFLLDRTTSHALQTVGRERLTRFLTDATIRAGDVHDIKPAQGELHFRYGFPARLAVEGRVRADGVGEKGEIQLHMRINDFDGDWRMDDVAWFYPNYVPAR